MEDKTAHWLLVADGEQLSKNRILYLAQGRKVLVLDRAYTYAKKVGLKIDILLGDFDAIESSDLVEAKKYISVIETPDQNKTDLEKGVEYLDAIHASNIYIAGATGGRLQHTMNNLRALKKYHRDSRPITMFSEKEVIRYYQDTEIKISGKINDSIGLLGYPEGTITTSGLKYDVTDFVMQFEKQNSVCNSLIREHVVVKIRGSVLVIHESEV